jgi:hypothetical protein
LDNLLEFVFIVIEHEALTGSASELVPFLVTRVCSSCFLDLVSRAYRAHLARQTTGRYYKEADLTKTRKQDEQELHCHRRSDLG